MKQYARFAGVGALTLMLALMTACGNSAVDENIAVDDTSADIENTNESEPQMVVNQNTNTSNTNTTVTNVNGNTNSSVNTNTDVAVTNGTIKVSEPSPNDDLTTPFSVKGTAEGSSVYVKVRNAAGNTMFTQPVNVRNGAFSVNLTFEVMHSTSGTIVVYDKDSSGNATNTVVIPVQFSVTSTNTNSADTNANENVNADTNTNADANVNE